MSQITEVRLIDDLDQSAADGTTPFGLDGRMYEIDLSAANRAKLDALLAPFLAGARRAGSALARRPRASRGRPVAVAPVGLDADGKAERTAARQWALSSGQFPDLGTRGRVPAAVLDAYRSRK